MILKASSAIGTSGLLSRALFRGSLLVNGGSQLFFQRDQYSHISRSHSCLHLAVNRVPHTHKPLFCVKHFNHQSTRRMSIVTAAVIVIGDEIIKGQVQDSNSQYICQRLHTIGITVKVIITVPDDLNDIAHYVKKFSERYDYVITSGGIGPTHDDITYEAIAKAFNDTIAVNSELDEIYKYFLKTDYTEAHKKLATVPQSAVLISSDQKIPAISVANVFVLPGIPKYMKIVLKLVETCIRNPNVSFHTKELYLLASEASIAPVVTKISEQYQSDVSIGSYPEWQNSYYKVKLVLESHSPNILSSCETTLKQALTPDLFVSYEKNPIANAKERVSELLNGKSPISKCLQKSLDILNNPRMQQYTLDEICIGFNGGKDCTAVLHMWCAAIESLYPNNQSPVNALYIRSKTPFPEVEQFIDESRCRYNLNMLQFDGNIKEQLSKLQKTHPCIKVVLMGTRKSDPHGANMKPFMMTDADWPQFLRVNPILHWSYNDVWYFVRQLSLPYCLLYDFGYTSLGSMENTHPNPALRYTDENNAVHFYPAYTLVSSDEHLERAGRTSIVSGVDNKHNQQQ